jgi:hypothetical protein
MCVLQAVTNIVYPTGLQHADSTLCSIAEHPLHVHGIHPAAYSVLVLSSLMANWMPRICTYAEQMLNSARVNDRGMVPEVAGSTAGYPTRDIVHPALGRGSLSRR